MTVEVSIRRRVRFLMSDGPRALADVDPTTTVLDHLRLVERRTGTKEGCAEGDCGACTVVVARPVPNGDLDYRAINACIQPLAMLDGSRLITIEDLAAPDGSLHPVQSAMVACHGSQCGFCTPGFVMSLFALGKRCGGGPMDDREIDDALAGNLCRCTGYAPIVRAAVQAFGQPDRFDTEAVAIAAALRTLDDDVDLDIEGRDGRRFLAPASVESLAEILSRHPGATLVAGATDVGLWLTKRLARPDPLVWTGRVRDFANVVETEAALVIGAGATFTDTMAPLSRLWPDAGAVMRRIGSTQVRNAGTVAGNIANGSPIGDMPPMLIALGARLRLRRGPVRREIAVEDFFVDYGRQDRAPGEFIEAVVVPAPAPGDMFHAYKVSKRFDQDISAVTAAIRLRLAAGSVADARIAFGGMAGTPKRSPSAEAAFQGRRLDADTVAAAMAGVDRDFTPLTDMRASASYRLTVARNLLRRFLAEATGAAARLSDKREVEHECI